MERYSFSESEFDLSDVSVADLTKEIELRHVADASESMPMIEQVAEVDGLTPLLQLIVSHAVPLI